ncbi:flagellin [Jeotgalibacillus proteolyticus]|uniref:Flagellin n=1 Tax=Jeotgalibacillus proteolyticus TaxID=2082395 RepID=A0A2S5GBE5_9BACL|nr:flagellin [Jeotgalibacillus proteolyticus]PPA70241.1 flagellin [Jeotgalibacillus proteolyticus]
MIINHNIAALNTHRQLANANTAQAGSMEKLGSGIRINKAGDDAAGLAISEKMRAQVRGLDMASKNAQDGISMIQTAEGALNETHDILQRMRELAVQSSNDTNTDIDRGELQKEVNELAKEITRIANDTEFNTRKLLDGNFEGKFHIGANADQNISLSISGMDSQSLEVGVSYTVGTDGDTITYGADNEVATWQDAIAVGDDVDGTTATEASVAGYYSTSNELILASSDKLVEDAEGFTGINISSQEAANSAITTINSAIETVSAERSKLGANQNRLEHTINNLNTSSENLTAAESRIRDVDMAKEMMNQAKNSILAQAAQAMLAQANQQPQGVLQLLR